MLGGNCSPCCGWKCYYTEDTLAPVKPTGVTAAAPECENETAVTVRLQWDAPVPGDCIPEMTYDVDISADYDGGAEGATWQPAKLASGGTAYQIERSAVITNNVSVKCEFDVFYTPASQVTYFRLNGTNAARRVWFRVRSDVRSGPYNGQKSDWSVVGPVTDPRIVAFSVSTTFNTSATPPVNNLWQFSVQVSGCGIATAGRFDIVSTVAFRTFPESPVWRALLLSNSSWTPTSDYSLNLAPSGGVISGYGLGDNPYEYGQQNDPETRGRTWLMVSHREVPEVMAISRIAVTSFGGA